MTSVPNRTKTRKRLKILAWLFTPLGVVDVIWGLVEVIFSRTMAIDASAGYVNIGLGAIFLTSGILYFYTIAKYFPIDPFEP